MDVGGGVAMALEENEMGGGGGGGQLSLRNLIVYDPNEYDPSTAECNC